MIIQKRENQDVEFKQSWRDEYLKWICAFANTEGGILYIGVNDIGEVCGVADSHRLSKDIPNKIKHTMGLVCDIKLLNEGNKDYLSTTPIQIRIYKDKIRLWNDGNLPKEVPLENLYKEHVSKPTNPNLANIFFKCGMVESWGRGFEKIAAYCAEEKAKLPEIDLSLGGVTARCFASDAYLELLERHSEKVPRKFLESSLKVPRNCPEKAQKTYIAIAQNPQVTSKKLSEELKISDRAVRKHIKELKAAGLIERIGSDRAGHWRIIAAEND